MLQVKSHEDVSMNQNNNGRDQIIQQISDKVIDNINHKEPILTEENENNELPENIKNLIEKISDEILDEIELITDDEYMPDNIESLKNNVKKYVLNDKWKEGLTDAEIKKYGPIFERICRVYDLSIPTILTSNLSTFEKEEMVLKFIKSAACSDEHYEIIDLIDLRKDQDYKETRQTIKYESQLKHMKNTMYTLKDHILKLDLEDQYKAIVYDKYITYNNCINDLDGKKEKIKGWLDWVIKLPWNKSHSFGKDLTLTQLMFNLKSQFKSVYGLTHAKEELMMYILKHAVIDKDTHGNRVQLGGNIIALEGPPGIGKTYLVNHFARGIGFPYDIIPLGGCNDRAYLDGHSYTYEGSIPGKLVQSLTKLKCNNGLIYIDEIDKLSQSEQGHEVYGTLLHILDPTQNMEFQDNFIGNIPINLSKIIFVISINDRNNINPILRQRMSIIKIPPPSNVDKINIAKQCIIPMLQKEFNFKQNEIIITDTILNYIVKHIVNNEKGVRNLKHILASIFKRLFTVYHYTDKISKINIDKLKPSFWIENFKLPYTLTLRDMKLLLENIKNDDKNSFEMFYV